jgi:hypothetical protein
LQQKKPIQKKKTLDQLSVALIDSINLLAQLDSGQVKGGQDELALLDATSTHGRGKSKQTRSQRINRQGDSEGKELNMWIGRRCINQHETDRAKESHFPFVLGRRQWVIANSSAGGSSPMSGGSYSLASSSLLRPVLEEGKPSGAEPLDPA